MESSGNSLNAYSAFDLTDQDIRWVENTIAKMTLKEKCAQLVMPRVEAKAIGKDDERYDRLVHLVRDLKVGGLIFFEGDLVNQIELTNDMQALSEVPLLVAADFERGLGMRLKEAIEFPYNMAVAAAGDLDLTFQMGKVISLEARTIGVFQNYSPVGDISLNALNPIVNVRSYSADKEIVAKHMISFIKGSSEEKVLTTAKHFPGHGSTDLDSHNELLVISKSKKEFEDNDLAPFKTAIDAGAKSIMVGHLIVPAYDKSSENPATLSKDIVTGLLKEELGFDGLIVTDAMDMHGITKYFDNGEATVMALEAGIDLVLSPPDDEVSVNALYDAVRSGRINEERIDYSVRKLLAAKKWLELSKNLYCDPEAISKVVNNKSHVKLAQDIADRSITLLRNESGIIPLNPDDYKRTLALYFNDLEYTESYFIEDLINENFVNTTNFYVNKQNAGGVYQEIMNLAEEADLVLVSIFLKVRAFSGSITLKKEQFRILQSLSEKAKPVIFMNMGNPYILSEFPGVNTYMCSYCQPKVSQTAIMKALTGEIDITGKLPVSIPNTGFSVGDGIQIRKTNSARKIRQLYNYDIPHGDKA